jgi:hypothetical protein
VQCIEDLVRELSSSAQGSANPFKLFAARAHLLVTLALTRTAGAPAAARPSAAL